MQQTSEIMPQSGKAHYDMGIWTYPGFQIRNMRPEDLSAVADIFYHAFNDFNASVGLPKEWESIEMANGLVSALYHHPNYTAWVAEDTNKSRVVGSMFLDLSDEVMAPGPLSIASDAQNVKVGRALMDYMKAYCIAIGKPDIRFVQVGNNVKSFALYSSLGYIPRDTLTMMQGRASQELAQQYRQQYEVRRMLPEDVDICSQLYQDTVGVNRYHDINNSLNPQSPYNPYVVLDKSQNGKIVGYTTGFFLLGHGIYATEEAFQALFSIVSAQSEQESVFHLRAQHYPNVLYWAICQAKARVVRQQIFMTHGKYREPEGCLYFPGMGY